MVNPLIDFLYLISITLFVFGLKGLSHPETARKGNLLAATGMGLAIIVTLFYPNESFSNNYVWIGGGMVVGAIIGWVAAIKVKMTKMPEMVSIFNGFGGACAMLIALVEFQTLTPGTELMSPQVLILLFTTFVGSISFLGSLVAYGKLDGFLRDSIKLPAPQIFNGLLLLAIIVLGGYLMSLDQVNYAFVLILLR